jgi:hypothetical protein
MDADRGSQVSACSSVSKLYTKVLGLLRSIGLTIGYLYGEAPLLSCLESLVLLVLAPLQASSRSPAFYEIAPFGGVVDEHRVVYLFEAAILRFNPQKVD